MFSCDNERHKRAFTLASRFIDLTFLQIQQNDFFWQPQKNSPSPSFSLWPELWVMQVQIR